jgi:hypothetical protein
MRRRAAYAVRASEKPEAPPAKPLPKGACAKCGKHIGRGVALHSKRCQG